MSTDLGEKIKKIRKELGLSQEEFAKRLGISRSNLRDLEIGKNKGGNLSIIDKLSTISGKPASFFIKTGSEVKLNKYEILDSTADKLIAKGKIDKNGKVDPTFKDSVWEIVELEFKLKQERESK